MSTLTRPSARRLAAGAFAVAAVAAPAAASALSAAPAQAAVPACRTSQLVAWLNTDGNGAAGTVYYELNFTNVGQTCTLRGYPGVSAVSQRGRQVGAAARRNSSVRVRTITLRGTAGGDPTSASTVHANLGIVQAGNFPASSCRYTTASGLRVYAPGQSTSSFVAFPFAACAGSHDVVLNVSALKR